MRTFAVVTMMSFVEAAVVKTEIISGSALKAEIARSVKTFEISDSNHVAAFHLALGFPSAHLGCFWAITMESYLLTEITSFASPEITLATFCTCAYRSA